MAAATVSTVKVTNVSLKASQQEIKEFFSFSGEIIHVEMQSGDELSQVAYITFKDNQGAGTATLLTGATIVDMSVIVKQDNDYQPPEDVLAALESKDAKPAGGMESALQKADDVVSAMLAKGFILGKDALVKAKAFDEKHQLSSTATARVSSFDKRIGLSEKISIGTSIVNEKVKEMDEKYQVSEKTRLALAAAEQTISTAGSTIMQNRYVITRATWFTGALNEVATAATDVGVKAKEKIMAEQVRKEGEFTKTDIPESPETMPIFKEHKQQEHEFAKADNPESPATIPVSNDHMHQENEFTKTAVPESSETITFSKEHTGEFVKTDIQEGTETIPISSEQEHQEGEFTKVNISQGSDTIPVSEEHKHQEGESTKIHIQESPETIHLNMVATVPTTDDGSSKASPPAASSKKPESAQE